MRSTAPHHRTAPVFCLLAALAVSTTACDQSQLAGPEKGVRAGLGSSPVVEQSADLIPIGDPVAEVDGMAKLTRETDGVSVRFNAFGNDIFPMDAFTFWAIAFNNPNACESEPCTLADMFLRTEAVGGTILNFGGGYDADGDAVLEMDEGGGHLARGSTEGAQLLFPAGAPPGLQKGIKNPYQAEIHVILRNHGMKESDPVDRAEQTSLVGAFCNFPKEGEGPPREDNDASNPNDGCEDQGVAIFLSAESPGTS